MAEHPEAFDDMDEYDEHIEASRADGLNDEDLLEGEFITAEDDDILLDGEFISTTEDDGEVLVPAPPPEQSTSQALTSNVQELTPERVRQKRSSRLAVFPLALGLIGVGILLLVEEHVEDVELSVGVGAGIVILLGTLVLTNMFRFFLSGRRERGLFFLAVVMLMWGGVFALSSLNSETFPIVEFWPLTLAGVGVAFFFTFLFERSHQAGLIFPGILLLFISGLAFAVTLDVISQPILDAVADYWPLALTFIGITLLPAALQHANRH